MRSRAREVSGARGRVTFVNSKFAKSARKRFISSKDFLSRDRRPAYVNAEQHESSIDNLLLFPPPPFRLRLLRLLRRLPPRAPARGFLLLPVRAELLRRGRAFPLFPAAAAAELVVVGDVVHPPDRRRGHVPGRGASSLVLIVVVTVHAELHVIVRDALHLRFRLIHRKDDDGRGRGEDLRVVDHALEVDLHPGRVLRGRVGEQAADDADVAFQVH
eukprot:31157-Pelagococcus_subviridis.AAC.9